MGARLTPNALKTHCVRGHPMSGDNLMKDRQCRECKSLQNRCYRMGIPTPKPMFCGKGHAMTPDNVLVNAVRRVCKTCRAEWTEADRERRMDRKVTGPELADVPVIVRGEFRVVRDPWAEAIFGGA